MENSPSACISDAKPLECSECGNISILNCACFSGVLYVNTHTTFCVNCHGETHQLKQEYRGSDIPKMVCINSGAVYCQFCNSCKQNTCVCCEKCGFNKNTSCICCKNCKEHPTNCYCIFCSVCNKLVDDPTCACNSPEWFKRQAELYDEEYTYSYEKQEYVYNC